MREQGATVDEIEFDLSEGRGPYKTWRGVWMVGQQIANLGRLDAFGENLKGNVKSGLTLTTTDIATAERTRFALFQKMRGLFERYDLLLTPAAPVKPYPVEWNFPKEINGKSFDDYIDWIAPGFLITLMSLPAPASPPALPPTAAGWIADHRAALRRPKILTLAKLVQQANPIGWPPVAN